MEKLNAMNGRLCSCGRIHSYRTEIVRGAGGLGHLPQCLKKLGAGKPFLLADDNTYKAAGEQAETVLAAGGFAFSRHIFSGPVEPDEKSVGSAAMHFDAACDCIVGIGSGVINDIGKILSALTGRPYIIVATAPSMDGYASATSSMTRDGLKISLPSRSADIIIGDTDILRNAPLHMMKSGLGDMVAKYVSICEWRISHLITGEYYCEEIAALIRGALNRCVAQADGLLRREPAAVEAVFDGLIIGGVAMDYAGLSRPASGVEHYISHVLDMRAVEYGTPAELHGIQCAVGTLIALRLYEKLKTVTPDKGKALAYAAAFDRDTWETQLRSLLGKGAESMIALEDKEKKYDRDRHAKRLEIILENWGAVLRIIDEELPPSEELERLLDTLGAPKTLAELGTPEQMLPAIFRATKDIRDKYVLSRLAWDLGVLDELI